MKHISYIKYIALFACVSLIGVACNKSDDIDRNKSIFDSRPISHTSFDKWLSDNYVKPYNINYQYRIDNKDIDYKYQLVPAKLENAMKLANIIKHAWIEAYQEVAGVDFIRKHAPAILPIIGSAAWNGDGTMTLGTAEGGLKITLYMANWLNPSNIPQMNQYFFKTMHHEFTHILQQSIYYPNVDYDKISAADYRPSGWQNRHSPEYEKLGFITAYAGSNAVEDITEVTACYITMTDQEWKQVFENAGEEGRKKLNEKVRIMKGYMKDTWGIDMDVLKKVVSRRMSEVPAMQLLNQDWLHLIYEDTPKPTATSFSVVKQNVQKNMGLLFKQLQQADKAYELAHPNATHHCCHIHQANLIELVSK